MMPPPRNERPLTELELEEIALNLDFDQSYLDGLSSDDDEDEVDLGLENVVPDPDDIEIADNMSDSSDEEPLAHYLPVYQKKWSPTRQFEPSQLNFQEENIDTELEQPIAYLNKYISDKFFEDVALFTNMREVANKEANPPPMMNFVMTTPKGVPLDFYLYQGKGSTVDSCLVKMPEKLDVGGRMVLKLTETLPIGVSVYTDRYFTSISLIDLLSSKQITLAGTIMASRIPKNAAFLNDNQLKKSGRGSHDGECEEEETPPLKQRKVQPVPDRRVRTVGNIHLPVFTKQ
ncbi:hypothetical protein JTB14_002658 [Gonioctena quinquepunctata]|nr:hypothetical protein JTB14_002658 [Gonioctena quinquepunctata]